MKRELTCIVCPMGCDMTVTIDNDKILVEGNSCPRGIKYAETECTNPQRVITSTMRCSDGELISVKTDRAIPKDKIFECMKLINNKIADLPISVGDVIIEEVFGSNIIATSSRK